MRGFTWGELSGLIYAAAVFVWLLRHPLVVEHPPPLGRL
jgi:hypothetical protein